MKDIAKYGIIVFGNIFFALKSQSSSERRCQILKIWEDLYAITTFLDMEGKIKKIREKFWRKFAQHWRILNEKP